MLFALSWSCPESERRSRQIACFEPSLRHQSACRPIEYGQRSYKLYSTQVTPRCRQEGSGFAPGPLIIQFMETKWLEDFISLSETRSFSRSAQLRHVTQPAFSRRIQSLESWAGTDLDIAPNLRPPSTRGENFC